MSTKLQAPSLSLPTSVADYLGSSVFNSELLRIDPTKMEPGATHGTVASVVSDEFRVYTAKEFPGMRASTALLKALRRQGMNVGVKKGSEAR